VQARYQNGVRKSDLSREFSIDRKTVHKYLQLKEPFRQERKGHHSADPYRKTILCLLKQNVATNYIFHVIRKQGYEKSLSTLRDYILKLRKKENIHKEKSIIKVSRRRLHTYLWSKPPCSAEEEKALQKVVNEFHELKKIKDLLQSFQYLMKEKKDIGFFKKWVEAAGQMGIKEITPFIGYLRSDWSAVTNALLYPWSNGLMVWSKDT
jgi:transposase